MKGGESRRGDRMWGMRLVLRGLSRALLLAMVAVGLFVGADLWLSRGLPDLQPWHTLRLHHEFRADMDDGRMGWPQLMAREEALFGELARVQADPAFQAAIRTPDSRFRSGGNAFARRLARDWNRSFVLRPQGTPRAVALLLHGLSDSPYSLRSVALALQRNGVLVYGLRLPGHGTLPGELDAVVWQDWLAATRVAARSIAREHEALPFWIVGYSMGAALAVKYTLDGLLRGVGRRPDGLVLISPALGVNPLARLANLQRIASRLPLFRKSRWLSVQPEYDPFKYQSFTKNAGRQIALLIDAIDDDLSRLQAEGRNTELPPLLAFQSLVDETVSTVDLVDRLFASVRNARSELVLFDLNRDSFYQEYIRYSPQAVIRSLESLRDSRFRLTVISNAGTGSARVEARSGLVPGTRETRRSLDLAWPEDLYSLSHIALPFAPDDPVYGYAARDARGQPLRTLGNLAVRGERNVLRVSAADLLRLRSNPFHAYLLRRIVARIGGTERDAP